MGRFLNLKLPNLGRKNRTSFLALCWFFGLIAGAAFSAAASNSIVSLMPAAVLSSGSISGLLTAILLPFLLSAFAVLIQELWLLYPIAFLKAFLVSFLGMGVMNAYGSAGWLVRWLLLFSECCSLPLLIGYWIRQLSGQGRFFALPTASVIFAAVLIGSFDYCIVSPFLVSVIS